MSLSLFYILCRWLHFSALMSSGGCSLFSALLAPSRFRAFLDKKFHRLLVVSVSATLVTAIMLVVAQTALMAGSGSALWDAATWQAVMQTHTGQVWQWQLVTALLGLSALALRGRGRQWLCLFCASGQLVGLAFTGHVAMADGLMGTLQRSNQVVHLLAAAFWAGGLLPVLLLMRDTRQLTTRYDVIKTLMCFSRYGHLAVALVVVTGVINSLLIPDWSASGFGLYTRLLLLKTLLVAVMCGVALFNRYWLVPRFRYAGERARRIFILTTLAEISFAALVLLLVSVFATLEPA
ncbi:copper homeostasis membrane protein CopD [Erwinia mallotivora]|uniref:Copper resistance protein D n=1 Tax=Erwinia mallotivora TaxID=69222 RepID=A0A014PYV0_9GAMM|nr:copper homeostasis membrane protein CopD [Erwinia mallotivora]EXU76162.1 copper resistance protein CopD [Erwinia mallotivora]